MDNNLKLYFTDYFNVTENALENYGAFNISLGVDLPLFVDPFLLFNSDKEEYQLLHKNIIQYLEYLRTLSENQEPLSDARLKNLFCFKEVYQNWFGFSQSGNSGLGLGLKFAKSLNANLHKIFSNFGNEEITKESHLEKLCLIEEGVGRDKISDFTTNLIKEFLCEYTETFAKKYIDKNHRKNFAVDKVNFNYETKSWVKKNYNLPSYLGEYVLLTPKEILTKDDSWINKEDYFKEHADIIKSIPNDQLRDKVNQYFTSQIPKKKKNEQVTEKDKRKATRLTTLEFPQLIDYFIKKKENTGIEAVNISSERVSEAIYLYIKQFGNLIQNVNKEYSFYSEPLTSKEAAIEKAQHLKDYIENKGGHKFFYHKKEPIRRESDLQILYGMLWGGTSYDVSKEVNDGRGPADFKISKGSWDKTLVEMKLASNSQLRRNLEKQVEIYQKASDAKHAIKIIIYYNEYDKKKTETILKELEIEKSKDIIVIDARNDNKPTGSKA